MLHMTDARRAVPALLFAVALTAACSGTDASAAGAPAAGGPTAVAGPPLRVANRAFEVIAVDGARLPLSTSVVGRGSCIPGVVEGMTVTFTDEQVTFTSRSPREMNNGMMYVTGYTQVADGSIRVGGASSSETGRLQGDTLTLDSSGGYLCTRHTLTALGRAIP